MKIYLVVLVGFLILGVSIYIYIQRPNAALSENDAVGDACQVEQYGSESEVAVSDLVGYKDLRPKGISDEYWSRITQEYERRKACNVPVTFYGKIVDQLGEPVTGAVVHVRIGGYEEDVKKLFVERGSSTKEVVLERTTDSQGRFQVSGVKGYVLRLRSIESEGYISPETFKSYSYMDDSKHLHPFRPDRLKPEVYKLWKKQGGGAIFGQEGNPCKGCF